MTRTSTVAAILLALMASSPVEAEPIQVTGGTVQVATEIRSARITFEGDGFFLRTGTEDFFAAIRECPCPLSTPLNLGAVWKPTDNRVAEAVFDGVKYPEVIIDGGSSGTFVTPSVPVTGSGQTTVSLPFTFAGMISAFERPPEPGDLPLFSTRLVGTGTATVGLIVDPGNGTAPASYSPIALEGTDFQLEYLFSPEPIPEPGTVFLLGSGLAAVALRRRRTKSDC